MKKLCMRISGIVTALILVGLCIYKAKASGFVYNDEHADGNTAGNLFNNGQFCEYDGKIYFSNLNDDGALYAMNDDLTDFKKLSSDKAAYINVAGNYITYSRINNKKKQVSGSVLKTSSVGIYRCELDGDHLTALDDTAKGLVHQYGNELYFQHYTEETSFSFNKMPLSGGEASILSDLPLSPGSIRDDILYYAGINSDMAVHSLNLKTMEDQVLLEGRYMNVTENDGYLYMMDVADDYSIIRTDLEGKHKETLVSSRCYTFNITKDNACLYYQVDNNQDNGLYCKNLSAGTTELLLKGDYSSINIVGGYVFFSDFKETAMFAVKLGEKEEVHQFTPPVLK